MVFYTARDLRTRSTDIWDSLAGNEEAVITNNGRPTAVIIGVDGGDDVEETLRAIRQARAMRALVSLRDEAGQRGFLSDEEIENEIAAARDERKS